MFSDSCRLFPDGRQGLRSHCGCVLRREREDRAGDKSEPFIVLPVRDHGRFQSRDGFARLAFFLPRFCFAGGAIHATP